VAACITPSSTFAYSLAFVVHYNIKAVIMVSTLSAKAMRNQVKQATSMLEPWKALPAVFFVGH
jgi:hypothetical protein